MVSYKRLGCVKLTGKMSIRLLLEALITKSSSLNFLFLIMSKISQVELYRTLIKPLGRNIEDYLKENPREACRILHLSLASI